MPRRTPLALAAAATVLAAASTALLAPASAATGSTGSTTDLSGLAPVLLKGATDLGAAPQQQEHLTLALRLRDRAGLDRYLATPGHADLTPAQFQATYGPTQDQVDAVTAWARSAGLAVRGVSADRQLVRLAGSTAAVDQALGTRTDLFRAADGTAYRSVATPAQLPSSVASAVSGVVGLSSLGTLRLTAAHAAPAASFPQVFGPKELSSFYDAPASATGSGQTVGVIAEGDLTQVKSDLRQFEGQYGLPQVPLTVVGAGSTDTSGQDEFDLDTQYASSQAPGASELRVYDGASLSNDDILSTIDSWAGEGVAKTASFSASECEVLAAVTGFTTSLDQVLAQAAAQGQSLFVSSGDNGSFCSAFVGVNGIPGGVPSVEYPASSPYAVGVGGTTVTAGALPLSVPGAYTDEVAWYAGGGGLSYFETQPAWQTSPAPALRGVPDVALDADPTTGYQVVVSGQTQTIGGTSASAPAWNGYWARALGARGALGFAGPRLYGAKAGFRDVVAGGNGLYVATPGYDYTTGLGTPDVAQLIPAL